MGTGQRRLPARPAGSLSKRPRASAVCRRLRGHACPPHRHLPRGVPGLRGRRSGRGAARPSRGCGRCARRAAVAGGRTGGGGGVPLALPSLLSGLITSVISKPGPGCECGAWGGSAGRGGVTV